LTSISQKTKNRKIFIVKVILDDSTYYLRKRYRDFTYIQAECSLFLWRWKDRNLYNKIRKI